MPAPTITTPPATLARQRAFLRAVWRLACRIARPWERVAIVRDVTGCTIAALVDAVVDTHPVPSLPGSGGQP